LRWLRPGRPKYHDDVVSVHLGDARPGDGRNHSADDPIHSVNILDARGQLVGQINDRSRTMIRVEPYRRAARSLNDIKALQGGQRSAHGDVSLDRHHTPPL
jgi:hypothetical protein